MSVQDINAQMAAALAAQSGETPEAVAQRVVANEADKASKLSAMLAQASAAKSEAGVKAPKAAKAPKEPKAPKSVKEAGDSDATGERKPRRNQDIPTRMIHVFTSMSLNSKFISSNIMFDGKPSDKQVTLLVRSKKKPAEFMAASDMVCETVAVDIPFGDELEQTKAKYHDQYVAAGFTMINNRPKTDGVVAEEPVVEETTETTETVDTEEPATV